MSRVTKEIASAVAVQLVQPKNNELKVLENELSVTVRKFYLASFPDGLLEAYSQFPSWFDTCSQILLSGAGLKAGYKYYKIGNTLPKDTQRLDLTEFQANQIVKIENLIEVKTAEIRELTNAIENALYNYRTYKNIEDNFPEAFVLLPVRVSTVPMINIKDIRCKLDKANC